MAAAPHDESTALPHNECMTEYQYSRELLNAVQSTGNQMRCRPDPEYETLPCTAAWSQAYKDFTAAYSAMQFNKNLRQAGP